MKPPNFIEEDIKITQNKLNKNSIRIVGALKRCTDEQLKEIGIKIGVRNRIRDELQPQQPQGQFFLLFEFHF